MPEIAKLFAAALLIWLIVLFVVIAYRMLSGSVNTAGLFRTRGGPGEGAGAGAVEADRLQLFIAFLLALAFYAKEVIAQAQTGMATGLPEAPEELIAILTGSNALYLSGKIGRFVTGR